MENQVSKVQLSARHPIRENLLDQAKEQKTSPGVYLMKDPQGVILYVGKAKNLRNRLQSYFLPQVHEIARTELLVSRIHHFDVILTETEAEALILENTLIKKHKPKFNVRLKDDKAYPYLKIQLQQPAPRIEWTRRVQRDGAHYFGPFPSAWSAKQVLKLLNETFQLRDCSDNTFRHRSRPCILYQMGKCTAPCVNKINSSAYRESVEQAVQVLEGKTDRLVQSLHQGMQDAAEHDEFEMAANYRDQIKNLELITQTQGVLEAGSQRDRDVVGISRLDTDAQGVLLKIRGGKLTSVHHYHLQNTDPSLQDEQIISEFLTQYYLAEKASIERAERDPEHFPGYEHIPQEVLLPIAPEETELLEKTLGVGLRVAENPVDQQLLNVAKSNADYALEQSQRKIAGHGVQALEEIQDKLHLAKFPARIECYDISNIQGEDSVASRVVFMNGAPDKNLYRRYKIRTVEGSNDFAMMKEVLERRFSKTEEELPDLVVVDGGKGQLSQATAILEELSVQGVEVVGLAKARTERDFQAKEVKSSSERIFIPNRKNPVPLLPHSSAFKLLTHIRDEAHRFAITYHRVLRSKRSLRSES